MFTVGLLHNHDDYDLYILFKHKNNETQHSTYFLPLHNADLSFIILF